MINEFSEVRTDETGDYVTLAGYDNRSAKYYVGCVYCNRMKSLGSTFFPRHEASDRCLSGGHPHCTCGTCW